MTTPTPDDIRAIGRSILFALACIVVGLSYLSIRSSLSIHSFSVIFADMLGGKPLPAITTFLIRYQSVFVLLSSAIPVAGVGLLFFRKLTYAFYAMGILAIINIVLTVVIYHGLTAPLVSIISGMTGQ
jgi:hypothetical protein